MGGTQTSFRTLIRKIVILDLKLALSIIYWYKNTLHDRPWKMIRGKVRRSRQIWVTDASECGYIRRYGVVRAIRHSGNRNGDLSKTAFGTYSFSTSSVRIPRESFHSRWRPEKNPFVVRRPKNTTRQRTCAKRPETAAGAGAARLNNSPGQNTEQQPIMLRKKLRSWTEM